MKELKMQGILTLMLLIAIAIGWIFLTVLRALLNTLSVPVLIILTCIFTYKFLNMK